MIDRIAEKAAARRKDEERLVRGERVANGFFSVLDRKRARIVIRRVAIKLDDE